MKPPIIITKNKRIINIEDQMHEGLNMQITKKKQTVRVKLRVSKGKPYSKGQTKELRQTKSGSKTMNRAKQRVRVKQECGQTKSEGNTK